MGEIICIVSGKGGVGKTTLCAYIALSLAMKDKKVVCIDCDKGLNNLDITLGMEEKTIFDLSDVLEERCSLHKALVMHPICRNLSMIPAPNDFRAAIDEKKLRALCRELAESFDFVMLDCPAGLGEGFASAVYSAQKALVIATPDITSIRDAARAAGVIAKSEKIPVQLIINRMRPHFVKKGYFENVDNIMDEIGLPLVGIVPEDEKIMMCSGSRRSLFSQKRAVSTDALKRIAARLCGEKAALSPLWRK